MIIGVGVSNNIKSRQEGLCNIPTKEYINFILCKSFADIAVCQQNLCPFIKA